VAVAHWRAAVEALAAADDPVLIRAADGGSRRNPQLKITADAAADMRRFASEFGMTPSARSLHGPR
jgi:P27 family predicted phage terminase small subunit